YDRRFTVRAADATDAHRALGQPCCLPAILSIQTERVVTNDYTIRLNNRWYQLHKPALPGLRGGKVVVEERRDGSMAIRFGTRYLKFHALELRPKSRYEREEAEGVVAASATDSLRSSVAPAATTPSGGGSYRPRADHPWRQALPKK